jgi:hypothetical protein
MKNQKQTIRKIVGFLNNADEDGGFWLPNIQRPFVWGEDQICRLFDSILREYATAWKTASNLDFYLLRCLLAGAFSGQPDNLLDAMTTKLVELKSFDIEEVFGVIRTQGRSLELTEERFWQMGYGSDTIHLLFNLWYRDFNHTPAYENNLPQVDHIFPQSLLRDQKMLNPETGRMVMRYRAPERDQLANCMLLSREENGSGGKTNIPPSIWFADKDAVYLDRHLIPKEKALWEMERFEDFIAARQALIRERFRTLKVLPPAST